MGRSSFCFMKACGVSSVAISGVAWYNISIFRNACRMQCPFPGMDPYLEDPSIWPDFHAALINAIRESILDRLPAGYDARIDERVRLVIPEGPARTRYPDVGITRRSDAEFATTSTATAAVLEPVELSEFESVRTYYIRVVHGPERDLVTTIDLLSPANKTRGGLSEHEEKRVELIHAGVNVVELKLLIGGERPALQSNWPAGEYYALVVRGGRKPQAGVIAWSLRSPLPTVPIPLRPPDPDVLLDLAAAFQLAYERGRYPRRLNYIGPPAAPLIDEDRAWALERSARLRV